MSYPFNYQNQNQFGNTGYVASQYRGYDAKYQPIGYVQSQYNQSLNQGAVGQFNTAIQPFASSASSYNAYQNQNQPYHLANYRGNQPGHDAYLRSDSTQTAQAQYGIGAVNSGYASPFTPNQYVGSAFNNNALNTSVNAVNTSAFNTAIGSQYNSSPDALAPSSYSQYPSQIQATVQNQNSPYHLANYRGNQPGHDAYLRSDSTQTAQAQYGIGAVTSSYANPYSTNAVTTNAYNNNAVTAASFNTAIGSQYNSSPDALAPSSYGQYPSQVQTTIQNQNSPYHLANYRGNQPGHDAYLRSDSTQTAQSQYGIGAVNATSAYNRYAY